MGMRVWMHVWRPEVNAHCPLQLPSTLLLETRSFTEPVLTNPVSWLTNEMQWCPCLSAQPMHWVVDVCPTPGDHVLLGINTLFPKFMCQELFWMSYLPATWYFILNNCYWNVASTFNIIIKHKQVIISRLKTSLFYHQRGAPFYIFSNLWSMMSHMQSIAPVFATSSSIFLIKYLYFSISTYL